MTLNLLHSMTTTDSTQGMVSAQPRLAKLGFWSLCVCYVISCVQHFATPRTVARHTPLSMGFSRQEYWSGWPCPPPGDLPNPGIESTPRMSPALADRLFTTSTKVSTV